MSQANNVDVSLPVFRSFLNPCKTSTACENPQVKLKIYHRQNVHKRLGHQKFKAGGENCSSQLWCCLTAFARHRLSGVKLTHWSHSWSHIKISPCLNPHRRRFLTRSVFTLCMYGMRRLCKWSLLQTTAIKWEKNWDFPNVCIICSFLKHVTLYETAVVYLCTFNFINLTDLFKTSLAQSLVFRRMCKCLKKSISEIKLPSHVI